MTGAGSAGRVNAILPTPNGRVSNLTFNGDTLYATCGDRVYRRKMKVQGAHAWASRNRVRRGEKGDLLRASVFGAIGLLVTGALFYGSYWVTTKLAAYEEFGDYLLRLGLSWLFLTFLAFLAFSGVVTALSTFFLSDDLRLLMASPVAALSTYPSTPVIWPAKKIRGSRRMRQNRSRCAGAWMYVLRWSMP